MKVRILGTRGSLPSTNPETFRYGSNTASVQVIEADQMLILDAGTGILKIMPELLTSQSRYDILLTHLHIDHIQGLGFFKPLFNPKNEVHIWGPESSSRTLRYRLNRYLSPPLFPVHFRDIPCKLELHEISKSAFEIGGFNIESTYISHPGPTLGYRISNTRSAFTYLPDHEPFLGNRGWNVGKKWISGMGLSDKTNLLIHDSQFTPNEYMDKIGWGHCSIDQAVRFASIAGVEKLLLFHHDPNHTDDQLEFIFDTFKRDHSFEFDIELAVDQEILIA